MNPSNRYTRILKPIENKSKIDVFIVDDDANNMQYFQTVIKQEDDIRCIGSTTSGENAVAIVVTSHPDVVLVDYALYPVSGFEVIAQLKEHLSETPIILLGGRATLEEKATAAGAAAYLPMPITPRKLIDTIRSVHKEASKNTPQ